MEIRDSNKDKNVYKDALSIRRSVFIEEQGIDENVEFDGTGANATHYVAYVDNKPVATARATKTDEGVHIQRVATLKEYRHQDIAKSLIETILKDPQFKNQTRFYLGGQVTAVGFYEKLGFKVYGKPFLDAGIEHKHMEKSATRRG